MHDRLPVRTNPAQVVQRALQAHQPRDLVRPTLAVKADAHNLHDGTQPHTRALQSPHALIVVSKSVKQRAVKGMATLQHRHKLASVLVVSQ
jgi:hypothetical protein